METTDIALVFRGCIEGSEPARAELVFRFQRVLASTVIKVARPYGTVSRALIEDLIQEVWKHIFDNDCRALRQFRSATPGAEFGFFQAIAFSVVHTHFRRALNQTHGGGVSFVEADAKIAGANPSARYDMGLLFERIDALLCEVTGNSATGKRDRLIFRLYYRDGLTSKAISEIPGIGLQPKGVEGVLTRRIEEIRDRISTRAPRAINSEKGIEQANAS